VETDEDTDLIILNVEDIIVLGKQNKISLKWAGHAYIAGRLTAKRGGEFPPHPYWQTH